MPPWPNAVAPRNPQGASSVAPKREEGGMAREMLFEQKLITEEGTNAGKIAGSGGDWVGRVEVP